MTSKNPKTKALIKEFYKNNKFAFVIATISYIGSAAIMLAVSLMLQIVFR